MNFAGYMKEIRKQRGLRQSDVARDMLTVQSYISSIETGKTVPTPRFQKLFFVLYGSQGNDFHGKETSDESRK